MKGFLQPRLVKSKYLLSNCRYFSSKLVPKLDARVESKIEENSLHPRHHPGILNRGAVKLPESLLKAVNNVITDKLDPNIVRSVAKLQSHLKHKKPPISDEDLQAVALEYERNVEMKDKENNIDPEFQIDDDKQRIFQSRRDRVLRKLRENVYHWTAISYDERMAIIYLLARLAPDYASLHQIFRELRVRDAKFKPQTMLDFGSGIGSAVWAAGETWKGIREKFCVDVSADMNNISLRLMQGGGPLYSEKKDIIVEPPQGVFFRQFLPSSHALKYDLVISAHSLLELPSAEQRMKTVFSLWRKTQGYLVLLEQGSRAAYEVIAEARDFILNASKAMDDLSLEGHVFAPCPHDFSCPRLADKTPCNFSVAYEPLLPNKKTPLLHEVYSYTVLRKGKRAESDLQWPRIVRPVLCRSRHAVCRLCTKQGSLEEVVVTPGKHGKAAYRCARKSDWGDLLPVDLIRTEKPEDSSKVVDEVPKENIP